LDERNLEGSSEPNPSGGWELRFGHRFPFRVVVAWVVADRVSALNGQKDFSQKFGELPAIRRGRARAERLIFVTAWSESSPKGLAGRGDLSAQSGVGGKAMTSGLCG
jgi:hypothetical protein